MRILIVDDDSAIRTVLRQVVENVGHTVVAESHDGRACINHAQQFHPDLILLDISMPVLSGFACARFLQSSLPSIDIIFVSQHRNRSYLDEAVETGAKGYVVKSAAVQELPLALQALQEGQCFHSTLIS